ncbi:hypothetical protein LSCM4_07876 [Leishmania orientalis]|uniref:DNA/RNA-binding protein Alba-like domain-containing protein n=1 Tax=Leishmania orientalis TaxID=2249476 RepID=A0A836KVG2_9TRYP|nr:hypothetical protein LSCM4_07876 [Leishmania orientalis]
MATAAEVPNNVVCIGLQKANTVSAEKAKLRLHECVPELTIAALDLAISSAVIAAQMLRDQSMVEITSICTRRGPVSSDEKRSQVCYQIEIKVVKAPEFDAIYAGQAQARAERRAARAAAGAAEAGETLQPKDADEANESD